MDKSRKGMNCAECRRSKLKCDRKVPCSSCVRRGCSNICPDGMQAATKGMKLIAAQEENIALKERVKLLEQAIRRLQSVSGQSPRECEDLSRVPLAPPGSSNRFLDSSERTTGTDSGSDEPEDDGLDAFGNLTVGDEGGSTFHGRFAHTEYLIEPSHSARPDPRPSQLPLDILQLADTFPYGPRQTPALAVKEKLLTYIPTPAMTWHMYEIFKTGTSWLIEPVPRREFLDEIYAHVHPGGGVADVIQIHPHRLAVLFMICATSAVCDGTKGNPISEYEEYLTLAKASLALKSLAEEPTIMAVQAVFLMAFSNYIWDRASAEKRWSLMGLVFKMVSSIGLHRESSHWKLEPAEVQRRRWIFWETCAYDAWMSFVVGRPPFFSRSHIDCKYPEDPEAPMNLSGKPDQSFHTWKHRFTHHCNLPAAEVVGTPRSSYQTILKIDRTIRKCPLSINLTIPGLNDDRPDPTWTSSLRVALQRFAVLIMRESMLLLIHRAHFAQALDHATKEGDLLHTPYTPSVLAVYRSSCLLIAGLRDIARDHTDFVRRHWYFWTGPFTAAIALAMLVIRVPACTLSQAALPTLHAFVALFESVPPLYGPEQALEKLKQLQSSAQTAHDRLKGTPGAFWNQEELGLELPLLDGRTRLISRRRPTPSSSEGGSSTGSPLVANLPSNGVPGTAFITAFGDVHPSVLAYFKALDGPSPPSGSSDESNHESPHTVASTASVDSPMDAWASQMWVPGNQPDAYNVQPANQAIYALPMDSESFPMDFTNYGSLAGADDGMGWTSFMDQLGLQNNMLGVQTNMQLNSNAIPPGAQLPVF